MKKITILLLSCLICFPLSAQEDTTKTEGTKKNVLTVTEDSVETHVGIFNDDVIVDVDEDDDTVKVKIGNKGIIISESGRRTEIDIVDEDEFDKHGWKKKERKFKGHWSGYELGLNNYLDKDFNFAGSTPGTDFLDLNTGKSWNANINWLQYSLPMSRRIGWVTGMGFEWNNYYFDAGNSIAKDSITGYIVSVDPPDNTSWAKSKLNTTYLTVPLLLEFQFGPKNKGFISFGAIGGLKLHSNVKTKYNVGGSVEKNKIKDDLNLSPLRYAVTVRVGYKFLKLYANYGMIPLFKENTGPEVYPINIGLILFNFN